MSSSCKTDNSVGARIKEARAALGLTQKELCQITGMKLPSLRDYELGNSIPGGDAIGLLTRVDINAHWLITGKGKMLMTEVTLPQADPRHVANIKGQIRGHEPILMAGEKPICDETSPPTLLDRNRMKLAIEAVEEGLEAANKVMKPAKKAELVLAVYDLLDDATQASKERVLKLVKLAA